MKISGQEGRGHLAMLVFSLLVAGSFSLGSRSANLIPPEVITTLRFVIAAVILSVAARLTGGLRGAAFASPWRYFLIGAFMALYFILMFEGLKTASAISTAAVFTLTPILAAGFGWLIMRQKLTGRIALALALGAMGALWVIFRGDLAALKRLEIGRGELIYFIGCAFHAAYAALVPRLNRGESALTFTAGTMVAGSILLVLWSAKGLIETDWAAVPAIVWVTLAYVALAATAASTALVQYASLRLPASKVMAYTYLVPSWVVIWEVALGAGLPPAKAAFGAVLTCTALLLLLQTTRPQTATQG